MCSHERIGADAADGRAAHVGFSGVAHKTTARGAHACATTGRANLRVRNRRLGGHDDVDVAVGLLQRLRRLRSSATRSWSPLSGLSAYPLLPQIVTTPPSTCRASSCPRPRRSRCRFLSNTNKPTRYWGFGSSGRRRKPLLSRGALRVRAVSRGCCSRVLRSGCCWCCSQSLRNRI